MRVFDWFGLVAFFLSFSYHILLLLLLLLVAASCYLFGVCAGPIRAHSGICPYRCNLHIPERTKPFTVVSFLFTSLVSTVSFFPPAADVEPFFTTLWLLSLSLKSKRNSTGWAALSKSIFSYIAAAQLFITRRSRPSFLSTFKAARLSSIDISQELTDSYIDRQRKQQIIQFLLLFCFFLFSFV